MPFCNFKSFFYLKINKKKDLKTVLSKTNDNSSIGKPKIPKEIGGIDKDSKLNFFAINKQSFKGFIILSKSDLYSFFYIFLNIYKSSKIKKTNKILFIFYKYLSP